MEVILDGSNRLENSLSERGSIGNGHLLALLSVGVQLNVSFLIVVNLDTEVSLHVGITATSLKLDGPDASPATAPEILWVEQGARKSNCDNKLTTLAAGEGTDTTGRIVLVSVGDGSSLEGLSGDSRRTKQC
jgi:hypothetical protein